MSKRILDEIRAGQETAFIDQNSQSNLAYQPQFVSNDWEQGRKVLSAIEEELLRCDGFAFSVAFITLGGITPLLQTFAELEKKGIPGKILTTDYLSFSQPEALRKLDGLSNLEVRMYQTEQAEDPEGFHTKGYIFKNGDIYRIIVGSSNMTLTALTRNREWNTKIISTDQGKVASDILSEFGRLWNSPRTKKLRDIIDEYELCYKAEKNQQRIAARAHVVSIEAYKLKPNRMQREFILSMEKLRKQGAHRALLISATATGKTYAAAFAMREEKQKRVLFLVHREQIARQASYSFRHVFGDTRTYGLLSGTSKQFDADLTFATMQTMAKPEIMEHYAPDHFESIIIDEVHRVGAESYLRIMDYFKPRMWLGMTASPERTDDFDVFQQFDHNIACEIRLQQALEENMLCPFHYFGITDLTIDGETIDDETELKNFNLLTSDRRVEYVMEQAEYYGHTGDRVRGLIFCSGKKEAEILSEKFNERGWRTLPLTGETSQEDREKAIERLTEEQGEDRLDYLITVDIFNEGVDIPEINQVIMLRPTQSPIVFVQQLGRGLRKAENKEYVVILDFIGNYKNNFMIPIALSGDRSYNKDNIRRYIMEGGRVIPGSSTIHFDAISRKRIFEAIDTANFSDVRLIRDNYKNLKNKLGRIPTLMDFDRFGEMDVLRIFDNKSLGSYYKFLVKYEKDYKVRLSAREAEAIEFVSKKLASGKRVSELEFLSRMLRYRDGLLSIWKNAMAENYKIRPSKENTESVVNILTNQFPSGSGKSAYKDCVFIEKDNRGDFRVTPEFAKMLGNPDFRNILQELIQFGIYRYKKNYSNTYQDTDFVLYQKYTYEDVCRLLNWKQNIVPLNIGGYKYDEDTKTFPVFINYDKADDITDTTKYEDHFIGSSRLIAISKSGRSLDSQDVQNFLHAKELGIDVELFVRKNKDDAISKEFYYLGRMTATGSTKEFVMPNTDKTAVEIEWALDVPVRDDLYEYFVST